MYVRAALAVKFQFLFCADLLENGLGTRMNTGNRDPSSLKEKERGAPKGRPRGPKGPDGRLFEGALMARTAGDEGSKGALIGEQGGRWSRPGGSFWEAERRTAGGETEEASAKQRGEARFAERTSDEGWIESLAMTQRSRCRSVVVQMNDSRVGLKSQSFICRSNERQRSEAKDCCRSFVVHLNDSTVLVRGRGGAGQARMAGSPRRCQSDRGTAI